MSLSDFAYADNPDKRENGHHKRANGPDTREPLKTGPMTRQDRRTDIGSRGARGRGKR